MTVSFTTWHNWKAVQIVSGDCAMIISTSVGPRVVSLTYCNGANLLYEDLTHFKVGDWHLYGGHRFTIAPESDASYYPDNAACKVIITDAKVVIAAPLRPDNIRLSVEVSAAINGNGFNLVHVLHNDGPANWSGALWAITCIPRSAKVIVSCTTPVIHYWPGTDPENWLQWDRGIIIKSGNHRGKAGWHQTQGWLAAYQPHGRIVIHNLEATVPAECADGGCNLEVFVCNDWIELETLGRIVNVATGQTAQHTEYWKIAGDGNFPELI